MLVPNTANLVLFIHLAGLIVGLGAVTVVDTLGFLSRDSLEWTQTTIRAHHVTKPLIWLGTGLVAASWLLMADWGALSALELYKTADLLVLIGNGAFLSFYISPRLDELKGEEKLFPPALQHKVMVSAAVSFLGWWSFVYATVLLL